MPSYYYHMVVIYLPPITKDRLRLVWLKKGVIKWSNIGGYNEFLLISKFICFWKVTRGLFKFLTILLLKKSLIKSMKNMDRYKVKKRNFKHIMLAKVKAHNRQHIIPQAGEQSCPIHSKLHWWPVNTKASVLFEFQTKLVVIWTSECWTSVHCIFYNERIL